MRLRFEKWEGLGNDFVLIEAKGDLSADVVRRLCDRRRGVGADGVLIVSDAGTETPRMIVRNADGSRPEMCGNGIRCVAAHAIACGTGTTMSIVTDAGEKACEVDLVGAKDGGPFEVTVDMGVARGGADLVAGVAGREHRFHTVDMGNPHAVTFEPYDDAEVDGVGPAVATLPPGGTNVEFCRMEGDRVAVTVWERGVGRTLACGTGACAAAAVACDTGRARFGVPVRVALPGGELEITVAPGTRAVRMRGPARRAFHGEVEIA